MKQSVLPALVLLCVSTTVAALLPEPSLTTTYRDQAMQILEAARVDRGAWEKLAYLCDRIGHRLSGSPQLEQAVEWVAETMRRDGLDNVHTQTVMVPRWVRGEESARVIQPVERSLHILGLGGSGPTPPDGLRAELVTVSDFDELERMGRSRVSGRIVFFNPEWRGYGATVTYRGNGPARAAALGAVAVLVRSMTPVSLQSPHTGGTRFPAGGTPIPAAAVSLEDAALLERLSDAGPVEVALHMEAQTLPDRASANVIGEIKGRELPEEVVVIGGHLDSWDVGQGAHDDGTGVAVAMQAAALIKQLGLKPRRTLRVVLWTNEENGLAGGRAYRRLVGNQIHNHAAAIEMDSGGERPVGFGVGLPDLESAARQAALARLEAISQLLRPIGADRIIVGGGGADIRPLMQDGVPGLGLRTVAEHYFDWHHSHADTLDKVDPADLRANLAAMTVMAFVLADMEGRLVQ